MRITSIGAHGLLSFDKFEICLPNRTTVIVGPNGVGKSNLGRILDLVRCAVSRAHRSTPARTQMLDMYFAGRRVDGSPAGIEVRVGYELTTKHEHDLVVAFVRAAAEHSLLGQTQGADTSKIEDWARRQITVAKLAPLFRGTIVVRHQGTADADWQIGLDFAAKTHRRQHQNYRWWLGGGVTADNIVALNDLNGAKPGDPLAARLLGRAPLHNGQPVAPSGVFALSRLLPKAGRTVSCALDLGRTPPTHGARLFADLAGIDPLGRQDNIHHYGFAYVMATIFEDQVIHTDDTRLRSTPPDGNATDSLAKSLLLLKNGPASERPQYEGLRQRFWEFSGGRQLDVLASHSTGTPTSETEPSSSFQIKPQLVVSVKPLDAEDRSIAVQVPIEFAGAGAYEALVLAASLSADASSVVVLDEPAAALHPSMQRRVARHLSEGAAQFIVITHSPYIVPYDLDQLQTTVVRFELDEESATQTWPVDPAVLSKISRKIRDKGNGGVAFASKAILCEGITDVQAVHILAERLGIELDALNIMVLDCGSRDNMPDYIALAGSLGIPFLAIMDGDATKALKDRSVARNAQVVRTAVEGQVRGRLVEFLEDIETTLSVPKAKSSVADKLRTIDLDDGTIPEIYELGCRIRDLAGLRG